MQGPYTFQCSGPFVIQQSRTKFHTSSPLSVFAPRADSAAVTSAAVFFSVSYHRALSALWRSTTDRSFMETVFLL
jgi:hypothetical protein